MVQSLKMSPPALFAAICMACAFTCATAQASCRGRCGGEFYRGSLCQCDYECIVHDECCKDYESQCTTRGSCLGRCGEPFKRGRQCTCDSDCSRYNQCCPDYQNTCGTDEAMNGPDSNTTPGEPSSCVNVNNNKPKEPTVVEQPEDPYVTPSTFSEGDYPDDYMALDTPDPQDDTGNADALGPNDPYSETGLQEPEPIPESTSGYGPSPTDLPEPVTPDPSLPNSEDDSQLEVTPEEMFTNLPPTDEAPREPSDNRPTQANTNLLPSDQADLEGPTENTVADASNPEEQSDPDYTSEPGTTSPQLTPTSAVSSQVSTQPTPNAEPYTGSPSGFNPTSSTPEIQPEGQDELQPEGSEAIPDDELLPEGQTVDQSTSTTLQPEDPTSEPEDEDSPNADLNQSSITTIDPSLATTTASTVTSKPTTTGLVSTGPTVGSSSSPGNPEPTSGSSTPQTPSTTTPDSSPSDTQDGNTTSSQADNEPEPGAESGPGVRGDNWNGPGPSPTDPAQDQGVDDATPASTSVTQSNPTSIPHSKPDQTKPPPKKPGQVKPTSKPNGPGPSPTDPAQEQGVDDATPAPTSVTQSNPTSIPHSKPDQTKPPPKKPGQVKPTSKPNGPGPSPTDPAQEQGVDDATPAPTSVMQSTSKPHSKPDQTKLPPKKPGQVKPTSKPKPKPVEIAPPNIDNIRDYQADDNNDTNLCSGRPTSGITTLGNGTMVVFRGHYFWVLDGNRVPGPARGITETWGVPSPVDTVFTRCNCQGKTYIFKGAQYWRFNNDMVDPGYPRPVSTGFDGLRGQITAALSVPEYRQRRESVYFFKRGGQVQKYSYQFGTRPTCGSTGRRVQYAVYNVRTRTARQAPQAASNLGAPINIRVSWRGFPTAVTSAVSVPTRGVLDGYKYYVFSRSKYYNVRMDAEQPVIATPQSTTPQKNSAKDFFKCPKEV